MNLPAMSDPLPLVVSEDIIRVAGTRVTLDTLIGAFKRGSTPEEIAQDYSAVSLADVCAVLSYYLRHRSEVDEYLERCASEHAELRREIEGRPEYQEFRERLLARVWQAGLARLDTATGRRPDRANPVAGRFLTGRNEVAR